MPATVTNPPPSAHPDGALLSLSPYEGAQLRSVLSADEVVEHLVQGSYEGGTATLVATDQHLLLLDKHLLGRVHIDTYPYDLITSVHASVSSLQRRSEVLSTVTIHTATPGTDLQHVRTIRLERVEQRRAEDFAQHVRSKLAAARERARSARPAVPTRG